MKTIQGPEVKVVDRVLLSPEDSPRPLSAEEADRFSPYIALKDDLTLSLRFWEDPWVLPERGEYVNLYKLEEINGKRRAHGGDFYQDPEYLAPVVARVSYIEHDGDHGPFCVCWPVKPFNWPYSITIDLRDDSIAWLNGRWPCVDELVTIFRISWKRDERPRSRMGRLWVPQDKYLSLEGIRRLTLPQLWSCAFDPYVIGGRNGSNHRPDRERYGGDSRIQTLGLAGAR